MQRNLEICSASKKTIVSILIFLERFKAEDDVSEKRTMESAGSEVHDDEKGCKTWP